MHIYGTTTHMRYVAKSHVLAQILYFGVRLIINLTTVLNPRCLDGDLFSHQYEINNKGVHITH